MSENTDYEQLYCTAVEVVELIWAKSEDEAKAEICRRLHAHWPDPDISTVVAFVSEPIEYLGWDGERRTHIDSSGRKNEREHRL